MTERGERIKQEGKRVKRVAQRIVQYLVARRTAPLKRVVFRIWQIFASAKQEDWRAHWDTMGEPPASRYRIDIAFQLFMYIPTYTRWLISRAIHYTSIIQINRWANSWQGPLWNLKNGCRSVDAFHREHTCIKRIWTSCYKQYSVKEFKVFNTCFLIIVNAFIRTRGCSRKCTRIRDKDRKSVV